MKCPNYNLETQTCAITSIVKEGAYKEKRCLSGNDEEQIRCMDNMNKTAKDLLDFMKKLWGYTSPSAYMKLTVFESRTDVWDLLSSDPNFDVNDAKVENEEGCTLIGDAASNGDTRVVKWLLNKGLKINAENTTLMCYAAMGGRIEMMKCLQEHGVSISAGNSIGTTPMHLAALQGQLESIKYLNDSGVDVDVRDNDGKTPMFRAAQAGKVESIIYLAKLGADVNATNSDGITPMFFAAFSGELEAMKCLKTLGGKLDIKLKTLMNIACTEDNGSGTGVGLRHTRDEVLDWLYVNIK